MKLVCLALSTLLAPALTLSQEQPVAISVTTTDGHPMVSVKNLNNVQLEAFLLELMPADIVMRKTHELYDVHANYKHDKPILPGASTELPLPRALPSGYADPPSGAASTTPVPVVCALVFSDGTTWGDGACIQDLLTRRKALAACLQDVMALLQRIADEGMDREEALAVLQQAWKAGKHTRDVEDQVPPNDQIFYGVIANIQRNPRPDATGPAFTKVVRHLRHAYANWLADLEAAKPTKPRPEKSL